MMHHKTSFIRQVSEDEIGERDIEMVDTEAGSTEQSTHDEARGMKHLSTS